jgi:chlorite dismutase
MKFNLILKKIVIKRPNNLLQIKTVNGIDSSNSEIEKTVSKIKNNSDFMINIFNSVCDKLNTIYENFNSINVNMK